MDIDALLQLIYRYELRGHLLEWAGIFRYLGTKAEGFTFEEWKKLKRAHVHDSIIQSLFRILGELGLVTSTPQSYRIVKDTELQRLLETVYKITEVIPAEKFLQSSEKLLWTLLSSNVQMPIRIAERFQYLNSWILHLIQTTKKRLIFIAPYYSVAGMQHLSVSLETLLKYNEDVRIDWIIGETDNMENRKAFNYLLREIDVPGRIRIFHPDNNLAQGLVLHAKLLLSDEEKGYLGSANFSRRGLQHQFEIGVALSKEHTISLTMLVDHWIETAQFTPYH
ncbi:phospholipase D-like domain-containing protein [Gorillibacterium sp. CAU 1737]|uniref:phospholipase D-like domain-containing protein n=1 Tax=Gorillibacterium sp. CAU 1737 TaxID=3140362 RepID=UPI00325FFB21